MFGFGKNGFAMITWENILSTKVAFWIVVLGLRIQKNWNEIPDIVELGYLGEKYLALDSKLGISKLGQDRWDF